MSTAAAHIATHHSVALSDSLWSAGGMTADVGGGASTWAAGGRNA